MGAEGLEPNRSNTDEMALSESGGTPGGTHSENRESVARFVSELRAAGFTTEQICRISGAMDVASVIVVSR